MNPLRTLESTIAGLVEGAFGRVFRSEVRPMELAHKLAREMDEHRTESVSRVYAPNEFSVWLSPEDRARYEGVEEEVIDDLCAYLLEHARREELVLASRLQISFHTDERLTLGEFGIQARSVRIEDHDDRPSEGPARDRGSEQDDEHGQTMIYSTSARLGGHAAQAHAHRSAGALLLLGGRRVVVPPGGAVIGRGHDCEVVLNDVGVSRRHAEIRPFSEGWTLTDLRSTNGVRVNGQRIESPRPLSAGDRIELGSTKMIFELR